MAEDNSGFLSFRYEANMKLCEMIVMAQSKTELSDGIILSLSFPAKVQN